MTQDIGLNTASHVRKNPDSLSKRAAATAAQENQTGLLEAVKTYCKAIGWAMFLSTSVSMEGFDLVLVGPIHRQGILSLICLTTQIRTRFAFPAFNKKKMTNLETASVSDQSYGNRRLQMKLWRVKS